MTKLHIDLLELVTFYDVDAGARTHSNSIKTLAGEELAFALMSHYFENEKGAVSARRLSTPCTTGKKKGFRLDGWFAVQEISGTTHFQVEVKSWSFHGYGEKKIPLPLECTDDQFSRVQTTNWRRYWDSENHRFHAKGLRKVMDPMGRPAGHAFMAPPRPLACLWAPLHPTGEPQPYFEMRTPGYSVFESVAVFSLSTYARNLIKKRHRKILVDMPDAHRRLAHLARIFQYPSLDVQIL